MSDEYTQEEEAEWKKYLNKVGASWKEFYKSRPDVKRFLIMDARKMGNEK